MCGRAKYWSILTRGTIRPASKMQSANLAEAEQGVEAAQQSYNLSVANLAAASSNQRQGSIGRSALRGTFTGKA